MGQVTTLLQEYPKFKSGIPAGTSGNCAINKVEVKPDPNRQNCASSFPVWAQRIPGIYTELTIDGETYMTDLFEELWSQRAPLLQAKELGGHVFISGLGLGMIVEAIFKSCKRVSKITVVEKNENVIKLVAPYLCQRYAQRLDVFHQDALAYVPPQHINYSVVWHDIWPNPYVVPESEIEQLTNKFKEQCLWQGIWNLDSF